MNFHYFYYSNFIWPWVNLSIVSGRIWLDNNQCKLTKIDKSQNYNTHSLHSEFSIFLIRSYETIRSADGWFKTFSEQFLSLYLIFISNKSLATVFAVLKIIYTVFRYISLSDTRNKIWSLLFIKIVIKLWAVIRFKCIANFHSGLGLFKTDQYLMKTMNNFALENSPRFSIRIKENNNYLIVLPPNDCEHTKAYHISWKWNWPQWKKI